MAKPPDQSNSQIPFEDQATGKLDPSATTGSLGALEEEFNSIEEQLDSFDEQLDQITAQLDQVSEQLDLDALSAEETGVLVDASENEFVGEIEPLGVPLEDEPAKPKKRKRRVRVWHVVVGVIVSLLLAFLAVAGWFIWDRWYRADDSVQIQGMWYAVKTDVPIFISKDTIEFTPDAVYSYTIDPETKSLEFSLGHLDGSCRYWFLDDGQVLILADGSDYTEWGSAAEDIERNLLNFIQMSMGQGLELPSGEGVVALARTPFYGADEGQKADASASTSSATSDKSGSSSSEGSNNSTGNASGNATNNASDNTSDNSDRSSSAQDASDTSSGRDDFGTISDLK